MKLRSKIISRNLFKSDQINYMHIRHKCSLSMIIHSHTGKLRSIHRKRRHSEKIDLPKNRFYVKSINFSHRSIKKSIGRTNEAPKGWFVERLIYRKYRLIEKFFDRKLGLIEIQKIFLVGTKLWLTAKNSVKWLIWVKPFWFPISLSIMQNMMNQCNSEWFQTCSQVANTNAPGNFPTHAFWLNSDFMPKKSHNSKIFGNFWKILIFEFLWNKL